ncbi:MAG: hypothetical protein ACJA2Q_001371 [Pseudohongiellaceae bacterium]|jgi:hypothetical protein
MKYLKWGIGLLLVIILLPIGVIQVASERIEVVELHTIDEAGESVTTRLWIVDDGGFQYLRVGADGAGWFSRIESNGEFEVTRSGIRGLYTTVLRHDKSGLVNDLMRAKYTWGDTVITMLTGTREGSVPIELHSQG